MPRARSPEAASARPRLIRAAMAAGWPGPSTRSRPSATHRAHCTASACCPAASSASVSCPAATSVSGWSGPSSRSLRAYTSRHQADRRAGEPGGGQALPGGQQHAVAAAAVPQRVAGVAQQAGRARPQLRGQAGPGLVIRPCLEHGVRRRADRPFEQFRRRRRAGCPLQRPAHVHGRAGAGKPGVLQGADCRLRVLRARGRGAGVGEVPAGGRAGQHGTGNPVAVQQRGEHQQRPGPAAGQQFLGVLRRQHPGDRSGRRARARPPPAAAPCARRSSAGSCGSPCPTRPSPRRPGPARPAHRPGPRPGRRPRCAGPGPWSAGRTGTPSPRAG